MSNKTNYSHVARTWPSKIVEDSLQVLDANSVSGTQVGGIENDCMFSSWLASEFKTRYAGDPSARRFRAMFSDGTKLFMFDCRKGCRHTDIGALARRWTLLWRWCHNTLKHLFRYDMTIVHHAKEMKYPRHFLRLMGNVDVAFRKLALNVCCFKYAILHSESSRRLVTSTAVWRSQQRHLRGPRFIAWHSTETFALLSSERKDPTVQYRMNEIVNQILLPDFRYRRCFLKHHSSMLALMFMAILGIW